MPHHIRPVSNHALFPEVLIPPPKCSRPWASEQIDLVVQDDGWLCIVCAARIEGAPKALRILCEDAVEGGARPEAVAPRRV